MIVGSLNDYLPASDLVKIVVVCVVVAIVAPSAVSLAIVGLDQRGKEGSSSANGTLLMVLGLLVVAALVAVGIYALSTD